MGWDLEAIFYIEIGEASPLGITCAINNKEYQGAVKVAHPALK